MAILNRVERLAYTVVARFPDEVIRDEYVEWLRRGHVAQVIKGGATSAAIVILDRAAADPIEIEVRYLFPSRAVFDAYVERHAPALRSEGLAKFPPERGVTFRRTIGRAID
jgi:hypothetical protein